MGAADSRRRQSDVLEKKTVTRNSELTQSDRLAGYASPGYGDAKRYESNRERLRWKRPNGA